MAAREERNRAREARNEWNALVVLVRREALLHPPAYALLHAAEEVFRIYEVAIAGNEARSTPSYIADCATATDFQHKEWKYSEPSDTWHREPARSPDYSAVSWQKLNYVYGPITLKDS